MPQKGPVCVPRPIKLGHELAQLIEAVLVAAGEVALVPGGYVSAFESHGPWSHGAVLAHDAGGV
jgi:hypothetical protein